MLNLRRQLKRHGPFPIYPFSFHVFCLKMISDKSLFLLIGLLSFDLVYLRSMFVVPQRTDLFWLLFPEICGSAQRKGRAGERSLT
jgi:hypothetical protein